MEPDTKKLGGGHHEDVSDISRVNAKILEEKRVPLLRGQVGACRTQADEDSMPMQVGDVVQRGGGGRAATAMPPLEP
jgi:hypothetical protein